MRHKTTCIHSYSGTIYTNEPVSILYINTFSSKFYSVIDVPLPTCLHKEKKPLKYNGTIYTNCAGRALNLFLVSY